MKILLSLIQLLLSIAMMGAILLQHRKSGGFSGVFGGGTQADMSGGSWQRMSTLNKITVVLVSCFMLLSLVLVILA